MTDEIRMVDFEIVDAGALLLEISGDAGGLDLQIGDDEELLPLEVDGTVIVSEGFPVYEGQVHIVPGPQATVLETQYRTVMDRITVDPIPKNYGLITYNGRTITVS